MINHFFNLNKYFIALACPFLAPFIIGGRQKEDFEENQKQFELSYFEKLKQFLGMPFKNEQKSKIKFGGRQKEDLKENKKNKCRCYFEELKQFLGMPYTIYVYDYVINFYF